MNPNNITKEQELENRINYLQYELNNIRQELYALKMNGGRNTTVSSYPPQPQQYQQPRPQYQPQQPKPHPIPKPKRFNEANIGKILMGIGAILLILISFGLFAVAILPLLNEVMKSIALITFSTVLLGLGTHFHKNKMWWVIPECIGLIGLYVSFVISNITLKVVPMNMLYILIIGWLILAGFYAYKREKVFGIIQQVGLFTSNALIMYNIDVQYNHYWTIDKMAVALPFYVILLVIENVLLYIFTKRKDTLNTIFVYCGELSIVILGTVWFSNWGSDKHYFIYLVGISTILLFRQFIYQKKEIKQEFMLIYSGLTTALLLQMMCSLTEAYELQKICISLAVFGIGMLATSLYTNVKQEAIIHIVQGFILICSLMPINSLYTTEPFYTESIWVGYFGIFFILIFLQILGKTKINDFYIIAYAVWVTIDCEEKDDSLYLIITALFLGYIFLRSLWNRVFNRYEKGGAYYNILQFSYLIMMIALIVRNSWEFRKTDTLVEWCCIIYCMILLIFNIVEKKLNYLHKPVRYIISFITMILFAIVSSSLEDIRYWVFLILILLPQITINTRDFIISEREGLQKIPYGMWVGLKYTLFITYILEYEDVNSIVYSLTFLILAICSITIGMKLNIKTLRIYGLILSMVSVVKLILFDIHYNSIVSKAVSFLVAGLLCLLVSYIYSKFEQNIKKTTDIKEQS